MNILYEALKVATKAHAGQVRKWSNEPYILHAIRVAEAVSNLGVMAEAAALLHDTVEDTEVTQDDLVAAGFPREIRETVGILTRPDVVTYENYILCIAEWGRAQYPPVAVAIKIADILDNLRGCESATLRKRYRAALPVLRAVIPEPLWRDLTKDAADLKIGDST